MKKLITLLESNEDWLMARILSYAKQFQFTKYTSTLEEAWRLSISGLSRSLIEALKNFKDKIPELHPDEDYLSDPVSKFGVIEAQKHRERGISLSMFLGLMKYYKQCYLDLVHRDITDSSEKNRMLSFIERCFDRIEIAFCVEWSSLSDTELVKELQDTNRMMTNQKNKYLTIFESNISPIILLDGNNKIVGFNKTASELFTDIKIAGTKYYSETVTDETLGTLNYKLRHLIESKDNELTYNTYLNTFQGWRYFRVRLRKLLDVSEKFHGTIILFEDITELKEAEKQLIKAKNSAESQDRMKSAFLANMSHDIRTPIHGILGLIELLKNETISQEESKMYYDIIHSSGETLLNLINDIIDISKIEVGELQINKTSFNIKEILQELLITYKRIRNTLDKSHIEIILELENIDKELFVLSDKTRFRQIMSNLLSNALKFTYEGSIKFGYTMYTESELTFYVKDTGIGIPEENHEQIFERFKRVNALGKELIEGTGLGLAICKQLTELLGGKIWVESIPNSGSVFFFTIPFEIVEMEKRTLPKKSSKNNKLPDWSSKTVLIAEDDETNFIYLDRALMGTGIKILHATNGQEAVDLFKAKKPEIVLMDIKMPVMDGYEATVQIKKLDNTIPVIAQTAFAMGDEEDMCYRSGCNDYLIKPIHPELIISTMQKYL
ncbi:MAG: response regulator [Bacteroidales bacterium]|nr:response regulator [Bacteroidales bacterium]